MTYEGQVIKFIAAQNLLEFFFETYCTVSYGEGATDENGKDVSFTTKEVIAFGVIILDVNDGRVRKHEQRSDPKAVSE